MNTVVIACSCKNDFQDERYGPRQRVHNRTKKSDGNEFRCTVCRTLRTIASADRKEIEKTEKKSKKSK